MVKREDIKPGTTVKVQKEMPGTGRPGPSFQGKLALNERLEVMTRPGSRGGLNLVMVKRRRTGEQVELMYSYITNFCTVVSEEKPPSPVDPGD